jgi:hypothetical protein
MRRNIKDRVRDKIHEPSININLPEIQPLNWKTGAIITGGVLAVGLGVGVTIGTQIFFGTVSMLGFALIAESNKYIKWFVLKGSLLIDLALFATSIYALWSLGPTIAGGLVIMGIEYTAIYAPLIRARERRKRNLN